MPQHDKVNGAVYKMWEARLKTQIDAYERLSAHATDLSEKNLALKEEVGNLLEHSRKMADENESMRKALLWWEERQIFMNRPWWKRWFRRRDFSS